MSIRLSYKKSLDGWQASIDIIAHSCGRSWRLLVEGRRREATPSSSRGGVGVVDAGGLNNARYLEPLAGFNIYLAYGAGLGTAMTPAWLPLAA